MATEAGRLATYNKKATLSSREIQTAVRLMLPGELAKHAVSQAARAVDRDRWAREAGDREPAARERVLAPAGRVHPAAWEWLDRDQIADRHGWQDRDPRARGDRAPSFRLVRGQEPSQVERRPAIVRDLGEAEDRHLGAGGPVVAAERGRQADGERDAGERTVSQAREPPVRAPADLGRVVVTCHLGAGSEAQQRHPVEPCHRPSPRCPVAHREPNVCSTPRGSGVSTGGAGSEVERTGPGGGRPRLVDGSTLAPPAPRRPPAPLPSPDRAGRQPARV
ncbi:MAG: hypothetical protein ACNA8R_15020 [Nitriliruptoraceae bacterium]